MNIDEDMRHKYGLGLDRWPVYKGHYRTRQKDLLREDLVGQVYGSYEIVSPWLEMLGTVHRRKVMTRIQCRICGNRSFVLYKALLEGKYKRCLSCKGYEQRRRVPPWLMDRVYQMKRDCTNPRSPTYKRETKFRFNNISECAYWIEDNIGAAPEHRNLDLVRIDNTKDYMPGNIMWTEHRNSGGTLAGSKNLDNLRAFLSAHPEVKYSRSYLSRMLTEEKKSWTEVVEKWRKYTNLKKK